MSRFWRTILFAVFALGFLISAPLVVLYTAGYRYQFGSSHIVKAGVLSVTSIPKGASVSLNQITSDKKTPAVIDNILPGDVKIRLEKTGYSSWEKTLPIQSGQSTFVPGAILFLDGTPVQAIDAINVFAVAVENPSRFAYLVNQKGVMEVWVKDDSSSQAQSLLTRPIHAKSSYTLTWSPDGAYLLLRETNIKNTMTLIRVYDKNTIALPSPDLTDAWFDVGSSHTLIYQNKMGLHAFGIDADIAISKKLTANDVQSKDGKLLVIESNHQSILSYLDANGIVSIIAYLPLGTYRFMHAPSPYILLEDTSRHHIILLDPNQKNPLLLNEEALFSEWSSKEDRLVFSNGFDIKVYSVSLGQTETITRFSELLTDLAWYPLGDEILYSKEHVLNALELDRRDVRNETTLVNGYSVNKMWMSKDGTSLFFFGKKDADPTTIFERKLQK